MKAPEATQRTIKSGPHIAEAGTGETISWSIGDGPESEFTVLATGEDTGLRCTVAEHRWKAGSGAGVHTHLLEDEGFYVLDGEVTFSLPEDGLEFNASAGDFVWQPQRRPHSYQVSENGPARVLQILVPGTRLVPDFFHNIEGEKGSATTDPAVLAELIETAKEEYGVVFEVPGTRDLAARHPDALGLGDEDGRPDVSPRATIGPFHSKGTKKLPMTLGNADANEKDFAIFHAFGRQTGNVFALAELSWSRGDTPWHTHLLEDEGFYILDGEMTMSAMAPDGEVAEVVVRPGDFAWAPRETPHTGRVSSEDAARFLVLAIPGTSLSDYFYRFCTDDLDLESPEAAEVFRRINAEYGIFWMSEGFPENAMG